MVCSKCTCIELYIGDNHLSKFSDNHSMQVIYIRPQNPSKSADTLETTMLAQGVC